ncbi:MAG TPA: LLM class flavin-dependent oxidoreductase [Candidatus Acidoferrales bacterium]|nr:LLM class flavin-dependent oxidoreductase [Candidatus Acidoferrales bacterium]
MAMVGIRFDLRVPSFAKTTHAEQYAACLEMSRWADDLGLDICVLSEHHGVDDGFMSAPVTLAAAIAGATKRIRINIAAILVPLHDPVRLAEQLAVIDLVSDGRLSLVAGLGYRQEEFDMAGVDIKQRGKLLDDYVHVLRKAWSGEPFEWRGRTIRVTPKPKTAPVVLIGGSTAIAAKRAARLHAGFFPAIGDPKLAELYNAECEKHGFHGGFVMLPGGPGFVHVARDPEKEWQRVGPHALYDAQTYASWQTPDQRSQMHVEAQTIDDMKKSDAYKILTPEQCVELATTQGRVILHPLMGGMSPEVGWEGLRLFEKEVLPRIR